MRRVHLDSAVVHKGQVLLPGEHDIDDAFAADFVKRKVATYADGQDEKRFEVEDAHRHHGDEAANSAVSKTKEPEKDSPKSDPKK